MVAPISAVPTVSPFGIGSLPMALGSAGQQFQGMGQPRFMNAPSTPTNASTMPGWGGGGGNLFGSLYGQSLASLMQPQISQQALQPPVNPYGPYGLLGQLAQTYLGPTSQTGWGIGTTVQPTTSIFGRMFA